MANNRKFQTGDPVRVRGARGIARIDRPIKGFGVYLLDRPMAVKYPKKDGIGIDAYVSYWTFGADELEPVNIGDK